MTEFTYGPVELHLVGLPADRPDPGIVAAIVDAVDAGVVRLLDFIVVSKSADGEVTVTEVADDPDGFGFGGIELAEVGIAGDEDIAELADLIPPGGHAGIVAFELAWARTLVERFAASGGFVLRSERIPAPVVNEILALSEAAQQGEDLS